MIEHRPSPAYVFLLGLALSGWCLHDPLRLLPALVLMGLVLFSYRMPDKILRPRLISVLLITSLSFAFCHFVLLSGQPVMHVSIYSFPVVQSLCLTLMMLIGLQWIWWRSSQFDWLLFSIGMLLMLSGVSWQAIQQKGLYIAIVLIFMGILMLMRLFPRFKPLHPPPDTNNSRPLRSYYLAMSTVLLLFLSLSLIAIKTTEFLDRNFSDMLTRFLIGKDTDWSGFSGHTYLQGGKEIQLSEQIAFTVKAAQSSDYWRGNILTIYREGHWFPQETLHLPVAAPPRQPGWQLYRTDPAATEKGHLAEIQMENHYHGILFAPAGTQEVEVPIQTSLYQNQYQLFRRELRQNRHQYHLYLNPEVNSPAPWDRSILGENLDLSPHLRQALAPLALRLTQNQQSPLAKARQIENWFQREFTYSLKVAEVTPGLDPTVDFVLHRKPAYCSWFASGMVLMLRSIGVPAHLVSGWRSMEWNPLARVWVVKEKEAHDWVEVLDAHNNLWVRFDPTPPGQLAELTSEGNWHGWHQLGDGLGILFGQLQQQVTSMSVQQKVDWLRNLALQLLRQPLFYLGLLLLLGLNQLIKLRKTPPPPVWQTVPELNYHGAGAELRAELEQLEAWLQERQLSLPRYQTLDLWLTQARQRLSREEAGLMQEIIDLLQQQRFGPAPEQVTEALHTLIMQLPAQQIGASPDLSQTIE